jgi:hypothetical protein
MNQPCNVAPPPYAKTATCSFAAFDEQGQIVLQPFSDELTNGTPTKQMTIAIPRQTLHGLWLSITETQPITFPALANRFRMMPPRFGRIAAGSAPAR